MPPPTFTVEREQAEDGAALISIAGSLRFTDAVALRQAVRGALSQPADVVRFEVGDVAEIDGGAAAVLIELAAEAGRKSGEVEFQGAEGHVAALVRLFTARRRRAAERAPPARIGILDQVGRTTLDFLDGARAILAFVGEAVAAALAAVREPRSVNWADVGVLAERAGADGLPIVGLISFLVGLILAFQSAVQLRQFGADIFVADAVALSVTRELGPLMVAIIVAGRSGAAFAAELGTMKVNEEVDALRTMGLCPYRFLVFPRVLALTVMVPLLTLLGDLLGLVGGFLVGVLGLGIPASGYLSETKAHLTLWDIESGVLKSIAFAFAVAMIGCERGLSTSGGATGVGRSTTSAVVTILFHLVIIDFAFTILFQAWDL